MKIDDLKDLLDIMVVFSIPVSLFTKRDALTQDITVIYPNIIPMFYDYDVDILTQFLSHYQFTIINYNLILIKRLQLSIKNAVTKISSIFIHSFVSLSLNLSLKTF